MPWSLINILRPNKNIHYLRWDIVKFIIFNKKCWCFDWHFIEIIPDCSINNKLSLVHVMAWHQTGNKPLPESMSPKMPNATQGPLY